MSKPLPPTHYRNSVGGITLFNVRTCTDCGHLIAKEVNFCYGKNAAAKYGLPELSRKSCACECVQEPELDDDGEDETDEQDEDDQD